MPFETEIFQTPDCPASSDGAAVSRSDAVVALPEPAATEPALPSLTDEGDAVFSDGELHADALQALLAHQYPQLPERQTLKTACLAVRQLVGEVVDMLSDRVMMRRDRRRLVCHCRQISFYVCHIVLQIQQRDIADAFGCDKSTVSYACRIVEDRRDDPAFDDFVSGIERMVAAVFGLPDRSIQKPRLPVGAAVAFSAETGAAHD